MKTQSYITINAPAKEVFHWLEDADRLKDWLPNIIEDESILETPEKVGSKFRQVYLERGKKMEMIGEITEYTENEHMRVDITGDMFDLDVDYLLTADTPSQTQLTQNTTIKFKGMMKLFAPVLALLAKFSSNSAQDESLSKLKEMVEQDYQAK